MRNSFSVSGIGYVLMLIVMLIVLLLVARAWKSVAPTAMEIASPAIPGAEDSDSAADPEADDEDPNRLMRLDEMKENTDEHAKQLEEARQAIDQ